MVVRTGSVRIGYGYIRFSSKKQGKGTSLERQTQDTVAGESPESWCKRQVPPVLFDTETTFRDLGRSAFEGEKQKELLAFLEMVRTGRIRPGSFLLVEKIDRISRKGVDEGYELCKKILKAGVSIVSLSGGNTYQPADVKDAAKMTLLLWELEMAYRYSKNLSDRVSVAKAIARRKAREKGTLMSAVMPPWLAPAGKGDERRAVVVPEKVALVHRLADLVLAGHGARRIVHMLTNDGTPPLTRAGTWSKTTVRRLLTNRALLGEHTPRLGTGEHRPADGDAIADYFPAVMTPAKFGAVQACFGNRKGKAPVRESKLVNPFSGLLKDARTGKTYMTDLRVEKNGVRHHVLLAAVKTGGCNSFPWESFERAVLACLREVKAKDVADDEAGVDEVLALSGEVELLDADIKATLADLDEEYSPGLAKVLRKKEARMEVLAGKLAEARLRKANPAAESLGEAQSLLEMMDSAADPDQVRLRLRGVLHRVLESIRLLVVGGGRDRLCLAQLWFRSGRCRSYLIAHRGARGNARGGTPARWQAFSFAADDLDLRKPILAATGPHWQRWMMGMADFEVTAATSETPAVRVLDPRVNNRLLGLLDGTIPPDDQEGE
jgi:DNA invertase Pin-like site-specific DNA recombinase